MNFRSVRTFALPAALALGMLMLFALPAHASYDERVVLTGSEQNLTSIPTGGVSFESADGSPVDAEVKEEDGQIIVWLRFSGSRAANGMSLPGTLVLGSGTRPGSRIEKPSAGKGDEIVVDVDRGTATTRPRSGGPMSAKPSWRPVGSTVFFGGGVDDNELVQVGAGTRITSNGEFSVALGSDKVTTTDYSLRYEYNAGRGTGRLARSNLTWFFDAMAGSGDDETFGSVAPGTDDVGIVYPDYIGGFTGIFLGNAGLDAQTFVDYDVQRYGFGAQWDCSKTRSWKKTTLSPVLGVWYENFEQTQQSFVDSPSYGSDIYQQADQDFEQTNYRVQFGADLYTRINPDWGWIVGATISPYYYDLELRSQHMGVCVPCGDPAQQNYTINIDRNDSDWGLGGTASLGLRWRPTDRLAFDLRGEYVYSSDVGGIFNPVSGDDIFVDNLHTDFVTDKLDRYGAALKLSYSFR